MNRILKTINCLLLGSNIEPDAVTSEEFSPSQIIRADENDLGGWVRQALEVQKTGYTMIATREPKIAALARSLNLNVDAHKFAVWEDGKLDIEDLIEEMKGKMLHTGNKEEYLPQSFLHPALFSDTGRLLVRSISNHPAYPALYTQNGEQWGILLPEQFTPETYQGTLEEMLPDLDSSEKESILKTLCGGRQLCAVPEGILIFRTQDYVPLSLSDAKQISSEELELSVLTGCSADTPADILLTELSGLSDFSAALRLAEAFCADAVFARS